MAHSLSAKKRVRQAAKKNVINRRRKSQVKTQIKQFEAVMGDNNIEAAGEQLRMTVKKLDKAAAKGTLHKNTVARKKSRLTQRLNKLTAKA